MPFAPGADETALHHGNDVGIALQHGLQLLDMALTRERGVLGVEVVGFGLRVVVGKAQHVLSPLAQVGKAGVQLGQVVGRQVAGAVGAQVAGV